MKPLSQLLQPALIEDLRQAIARGEYPGLDFETAMKFLLTDGIVPASDLPVASLLRLEDWARTRTTAGLDVTATELKNRTGAIIEEVLRGRTVTIHRHGRAIAEIRPLVPPER
jgi:hypothetical protein